MGDYNDDLNYFLVKVFNEILRTEEASLRIGEFKNLSIREMHVIEAVCTANENGEDNRATDIARALRISAGTLTTTVALLEKKGYLKRKRDSQDKRIIRLNTTDKGIKANQFHQNFHKQMVSNVIDTLKSGEVEILIKGLSRLKEFFDSKK